MAYIRYIISIVVVLLCISVAHSGDRKTNRTYNNGDFITLLDKGECDDIGCVIRENITQGGLLYQWIDKNNDNVCDVIRVWKPIVDPTFGTFYTLYTTKTCGGSI